MKNSNKIFLSTAFCTILALFTSWQVSAATPDKSDNNLVVQNNPRHIALLLPLRGLYSDAGIAVRDGFLGAYYAEAPSITSPTLVRVYDTAKGQSIASLYQQAIIDKANIVIGPLLSDEVTQMRRVNLTIPVITLNFSAGTPALPLPNFYEFGYAPLDEAVQVANKAWDDHHKNVVIIYPTAAWGSNIANAFAKQWQTLGGNVVGTFSYGAFQDLDKGIKTLFQIELCQPHETGCGPRYRKDVDAIFLVAAPDKAKQIASLLRVYTLNSITTYSTSLIYDGLPNTTYYSDLNDVYFTEMPWLLNNNPKLQNIHNRITSNWPNPYQNYNRLYALGADAYAIAARIGTLASSSNNKYNGMTGDIYINSQQQILRQLPLAQFRNGEADKVN